MSRDPRLAALYDRLNDLLAAVDAYAAAVRAEREAAAQNAGLHRLLGLQERRLNRIREVLEDEVEETVRDLLDRDHVIEEARNGRFN